MLSDAGYKAWHDEIPFLAYLTRPDSYPKVGAAATVGDRAEKEAIHKAKDKDWKVEVVADVSCDIECAVAPPIKPSTIAKTSLLSIPVLLEISVTISDFVIFYFFKRVNINFFKGRKYTKGLSIFNAHLQN